MLFQDNIPDPHVGFYSKNVLGDDAINGEVSVLKTSNGEDTDFVYDSWFYGYYLNGPSNGSPQTQGYLNNVSESYIFLGAINTGSSPRGGWTVNANTGWMYLHISPFAFDDTKKYLWVWIENYPNGNYIQRWFLFNRYYCIKDYRLGLDNFNFNTLSTSSPYYWIRQVLSYSVSGVMNMTGGEGILSYGNLYSGRQFGWILLKPYHRYGENHLRAYYGSNSSIQDIDLW